MSKFQIIVLVIFGFAIVGSVAVFSLYSGSGSQGTTVTVWGDIGESDFRSLLNTPLFTGDRSIVITYAEKSADTIEAEFTEALARGVGPDLIIITNDILWKNRPKLALIPYGGISERDFKTIFIEEGELFLNPQGIYALPLYVDPLVLFYNRDLISAVGLAVPMSYWDEIYAEATNLSKIDSAGNLVTSVMALGESFNIPHAKDVLSLLMLQAGTPITSLEGNLGLRSQIINNYGLPVAPSESALNFYTQFSNPAKAFYSWNRSLVDAQTHFTSGDSAYYIGFASELRTLKNKNPNLNFGISSVPQSRVSDKKITYGRISGLAVSRGSKNLGAAYSAAVKLVSQESSLALSEILNLPPARRDLLTRKPSEAFLSVFYDAAIQSRGWLDPDSVKTDKLFRTAIESVTSGRARTFEALSKLNSEIESLIKE